jgi:uncharacterized protein YcfJ
VGEKDGAMVVGAAVGAIVGAALGAVVGATEGARVYIQTSAIPTK